MSTESASTREYENAQVGVVRADPAQVRASDAEREEALRSLAVHYADGRLDRAEFDERADAALAALTREQLRGLSRDLPQPAAVRPSADPAARAPRAGAPSRFGPPRIPAPLLLLVPLLLAVAVTAAVHGVPPFPLIPLLFLLIRGQRHWRRREPRPWI